MTRKLFSRNFTLLVLGQVCSLIGNFTLKFALSMYVLERTGSATVFATLLAIAMLPTILLSPFGGMVADRLNRRNIMVALDLLSGMTVLAAFLLFREDISIELIGVLLVLLSVLGAFESPTVQACVPQMQTGENVLKGNAVVSQISAVAGLVTPFAGSVLYTAVGIKPILLATMICFFVTALFECFIRLDYQKPARKQRIGQIVKEDFAASMQFLGKQQPAVLKLLLLAALVSLFAVGIMMVGFPFLVRTVLGLSAKHYGIAESAIGASAIVGGISVGFLAKRLPTRKLHWTIITLGLCMLPAGIAFVMPMGTTAKYLVLVLMFCVGQVACIVFSIFAMSLIQQRTPQLLTGKVMSYVFTISLCAQPLGQLVYGYLFDVFAQSVQLLLLPSGIIICTLGFLFTGFFSRLERTESTAIL